jgi:hypothetical protein
VALSRFPLVASLFSCAALASVALADTGAVTILDDASLNTVVSQVRTDFLAQRSGPQPGLTRLDMAVLLPNPDGTWRRGSFNPTNIAYPASTVKLGILAAAMNWCRTNGKAYTFLDADVYPMVKDSDNIATGRVIDAITGAPNDLNIKKSTDAAFTAWDAKRLYTWNYLNGRGLLENQRIYNKTYPSNSGPSLVGAESVGFNVHGSNQMQPKCAASLMLEIQKGFLEPGAQSYMKSLLAHNRWDGNSVGGHGLPPGSVYQNKWGQASGTEEDIIYAVLPNGKEFILAMYSNGYESTQPYPYDQSILSNVTEMLIERLGLDAGNPPKVKIENGGAGFSTTGTWSTSTGSTEASGGNYAVANGGTGSATATYALNVPEAGRYEVCVWYPQGTNRATDAPFTVNSTAGATTVRVNQQLTGGRWVRLGDFDFAAGAGSVVLSNQVANTAQVVIADAVKATKWFNPPTSQAMHVNSIAMSKGTLASSSTYYYGLATVTVKDAAGNVVPGCNVKCTWTGVASDFQSATTDATGTARFQGPYTTKHGTSTFNVTDLIKDNCTYAPGANVATSGSIGL